jgi:hypothetical protein
VRRIAIPAPRMLPTPDRNAPSSSSDMPSA